MYEDQIQRIKDTANSSTEPIVQAGVIDALKEYGKQAIEAISEVVNSPIADDRVKEHGLKVIEDIRKNSAIDRK
ncbi:MAG TPA: hypothetical protein VH415_05915 [Nitrososphaeraceae archaeon]